MAKKITNIQGLGDEGKDLMQASNSLLQIGISVQKQAEILNQGAKDYTKSLQQSTSEMDKLAAKLASANGIYSDLSYKISNIEDANNGILKSFKAQEFALRNNLEISEAEAILARQDLATQMIKNSLTLEERDLVLSKYDELQKNLKIQEKEVAIAEKIKEYDEERDKALAGITEKSKVLKDIITDQRVAAAVFVNQLFKGFNTTKELFSEVREEGFSVGQAFHETGLAMSDAFSLGGTSAKDSLEVMKGMRSEMGSIEKVTSDARREAASLAKTFGISNEEAGKLTATFATMPGATMESANNSLEYAGNLAKAAGVAPGEVMKDIANSSEDVAAFTKDGGKNIATAAVAAKKLGMEFGSLTKMADQLLDFESSIGKQMEASVLLGKEINLDKARQAALNGDLVTMTQEVLNNVGGEAEFNNMNLIQRKALADSLGVSVTDLGKMVKHQDELTNLTQEQQEALATGELSMDEVLANAGGLASKMAEGATSIVSGVVGFGEMSKGLKNAAGEAKSLFGGIMGGIKGMKGGGGIKGGIKGMMGKTPDIETDAIDKTSKVKGPGGFKKAMQEMAGGLRALGSAKVLRGIGNLALFGLAAIPAIAGIPFMVAVGIGGVAAGIGMMGLAEGLKGKGMGAALVSTGVGNLALFGLAGILAVGAIPFMVTMLLGKYIGMGLEGLASGLKAMGNPAVGKGVGILSILALTLGASILMMGIGIGIAAAGLSLLFAELKEMPIENMLLMPIALAGMGVGLGLLAMASYFAFPGLLLASFALGAFAAVLAIMQPVMEMGGLQSLAEGLTALAGTAGGLSEVSAAVLGIGAGLGLMALAGLAALPIIGALVGLALVAPMLGKLGGLFGGGDDSAKEDGMDTLIDEIRQLRAIVSQGGVINMDGKKVGDVIGLSVSNARIA